MNGTCMASAVSGRHAAAVPDRSREAGMLLALDGRCLERLALPAAMQICSSSAGRLDILVAHPPKPALSLLAGFLMDLERRGLDYRLTSTEGELDEELVPYVRRLRHVSVILLDCLQHWDGEHDPTLDALRAEGYRVISLLDHRRGTRTTVLSESCQVAA
jgi:hypothetical protein